MLSIERLQALRAVSTFGSVTGAATALRLTPSAISQQISKLQRDVGQRLIEPYGRGIRLTAAGTLLTEHAHAILAEVEQAESELDRQRDQVFGSLEVAGFATACRALLARTVGRVTTAHPQLSVRLSERQTEDCIRLVAAGHLDLAVVNDWMNAPLVLPDGIDHALLVEDPVDLVVPATHRLAGRTRVDVTDLAAEPWITWPGGASCHEWLTQTLRQHHLTPDVRHTAEEHQTQLAMVAAGLGIAVIPRLGRGPVGDEVALLELRPQFSRRLYVIWRSLAAGRPAITTTVAMLREVASEAIALD